jgi:hypothetical protein
MTIQASFALMKQFQHINMIQLVQYARNKPEQLMGQKFVAQPVIAKTNLHAEKTLYLYPVTLMD